MSQNKSQKLSKVNKVPTEEPQPAEQPNYEINVPYITSTMKKYINQGVKRDFVKELEFLYNLLSPVNIRMRVEIIEEENAAHAVQSRKGKKKNKVLDEPNFSHFSGVTGGRIILTQNRNKSNFNYPLAFEANGLVLDSKNYDVLCMPALAFNPKVNRREIIDNFASYTIYPVFDGTTINLYYYEDEWIMSSTNGYEIDDFKWMGEKTYRQAFDEIVALYPEFSLDKLQKNYSYTIGFRFSDFHPFIADKPRAWFIHAYDRSAYKLVDANIGLPQQSPISIADIMKTTNPTGESISYKPGEVYEAITNINATSIDTYMATFTNNSKRMPDINTQLEMVKKMASSLKSDQEMHPAINYGFILRSNALPGKYCSNVIMESELLKKIRLYIYNLPKGPMLKELESRGVKLDQSTRTHFLILRNYLDRTNRDSFLRLFPNFNTEVLRYESMFNSVSTRILQYLKNRKTKSLPVNDADPAAIIVDKIAKCLSVSISRNEQMNPHDIDTREIIYDLIVNEKYIDLYYNVLY